MKIYLSPFFTVAFVLFVGAFTSFGQACPGSSGCLDTSFGNAGFVVASVNGGVGTGWANGAAIQPNGKIVVAAESVNAENTSAWDNYVLRFNSDGTLDTGQVAASNNVPPKKP